MARVLVTGATGYVGGRLVPELLAAGHEVVCLARSPGKLRARPWHDEVEVVQGDVRDVEAVAAAMEGCVAAYYLVHSMDGEGGFAERDRRFAEAFRSAAERAGVGRIVYLGGLGTDDGDELSEHLRSRHEVGRVLAAGPVAVVELRAAIIIGSGSASFEMLRNLVEVLPVMVTPKWVRTRCQPIAVRDVLFYLVGSVEVPLDRADDGHLVLEIGGPDVLTYRQMMDEYAEVAGLRKRVIVNVPVLSPWLSSLWIGLVTPLPTGLGRPLVHSLVNEVTADTTLVDELMPRTCLPLTNAVRLALARVQDLAVPSSWADAELARPGLVARREAQRGSSDDSAEPQPHDPTWAGGTVLSDERSVEAAVPVEAVWRSVTQLGGERGWLAADLLWDVRGVLDKLIGGIGTRRGRRHPDDLAVGDALDFWRVAELVPEEHLLLQAEMKVPGEAWLEFRTIDLGGGRARLEQRARFRPRGLWGRVYWASMVPFHAFIFPVMARRIVERAARLVREQPVSGRT